MQLRLTKSTVIAAIPNLPTELSTGCVDNNRALSSVSGQYLRLFQHFLFECNNLRFTRHLADHPARDFTGLNQAEKNSCIELLIRAADR